VFATGTQVGSGFSPRDDSGWSIANLQGATMRRSPPASATGAHANPGEGGSGDRKGLIKGITLLPDRVVSGSTVEASSFLRVTQK